MERDDKAHSVLPKTTSQFKEKQYWNNFFQKLKNTENQFFEWYGNYADFKCQLADIFRRHEWELIKQQFNSTKNPHESQQPLSYRPQPLNIFHIGCGKSTFGQDIQLDYPNYKVINTDYSQEIIKDMIKRTLLMKLFMCKYQVCDMLTEEGLGQKYQGKYDIVLDKGTLDAVLPEDISEEVAKIKRVFFGNVQQAFKKGQKIEGKSQSQGEKNAKKNKTESQLIGRYLIISMLQPFVLRTILEHFWGGDQMDKKTVEGANITKKTAEMKTEADQVYQYYFQVIIQQSQIKNSQMQPFLINIAKLCRQRQRPNFKTQDQFLKKLSSTNSIYIKGFQPNSPLIKCKSIQDAMLHVRELQQYQQKHKGNSLIKEPNLNSISVLIPDRLLQFKVMNPLHQQQQRYHLKVYDHSNVSISKSNTCVVYIIPQCSQWSSTYSSRSSIRQLSNQAFKFSRIIFVSLIAGRQNNFNNLQIEQVKQQLNGIIPQYVQSGVRLKNVQYLSSQKKLGCRETLCEGKNYLITVHRDTDLEAENKDCQVKKIQVRTLVSKAYPLLALGQHKVQYVQHKEVKSKEPGSMLIHVNPLISIDYMQHIRRGIINLHTKPLNQSSLMFIGIGAYCMSKYVANQYKSNVIVLVQSDSTQMQLYKNEKIAELLEVKGEENVSQGATVERWFRIQVMKTVKTIKKLETTQIKQLTTAVKPKQQVADIQRKEINQKQYKTESEMNIFDGLSQKVIATKYSCIVIDTCKDNLKINQHHKQPNQDQDYYHDKQQDLNDFNSNNVFLQSLPLYPDPKYFTPNFLANCLGQMTPEGIIAINIHRTDFLKNDLYGILKAVEGSIARAYIAFEEQGFSLQCIQKMFSAAVETVADRIIHKESQLIERGQKLSKCQKKPQQQQPQQSQPMKCVLFLCKGKLTRKANDDNDDNSKLESPSLPVAINYDQIHLKSLKDQVKMKQTYGTQGLCNPELHMVYPVLEVKDNCYKSLVNPEFVEKQDFIILNKIEKKISKKNKRKKNA